MKNSLIVAAILACALPVSIALADDAQAPADPGMHMDAGMGTGMDQQMSRMHQNMTAAQQQMERFQATTDPKSRRKLMKEHMQTLQESMAIMRDMASPMMKGGGHEGGMTMPPHQPPAGSDMKQRHDMMHGHMQMMQMLLEQMMQQEQMLMEAMPSSDRS